MTSPQITTVSCAGPDDHDDPEDVARLAAGNPLIEIGLQMSRVREGTREYPSRDWISRFAEKAADLRANGVGIRAALHVNGEWCRSICSGHIPTEIASLLSASARGGDLFQRIQLNFDSRHDGIRASALGPALLSLSRPVILQSKPSNNALLRFLEGTGAEFDVLFDTSGGYGKRSGKWPDAFPGRFNAWAGGLGPDTLAADIPAIAAKVPAGGVFGIDAQRYLRTGDGLRFSVERAAAFAEGAMIWNTSGAAGLKDPETASYVIG